MEQFHGTTIIAVRTATQVALGGDGQVTLGHVVFKSTANKIRKLYNNKIIAGFAGATADAFTLFERFEVKLEQFNGDLMRSAIGLAKEWRTDRMLQKLEAMLIVADHKHTLIITGNGDILEPEHGIASIGSGGSYALAAAKALKDNTNLNSYDIVKTSLNIAGEICIYTNHNHIIEVLDTHE